MTNEFDFLQADGKAVLVVDDLLSARKVLIRMLTQLGVSNIAEAGDGIAALEKIRAGGLSLVISDWHMPKMTGIELLREVRSSEELKHLPFMLITSASQKEAVIEAAKSGVSDYVIKPFTIETLSVKIRGVFERLHRHDKKSDSIAG